LLTVCPLKIPAQSRYQIIDDTSRMTAKSNSRWHKSHDFS